MGHAFDSNRIVTHTPSATTSNCLEMSVVEFADFATYFARIVARMRAALLPGSHFAYDVRISPCSSLPCWVDGLVPSRKGGLLLNVIFVSVLSCINSMHLFLWLQLRH